MAKRNHKSKRKTMTFKQFKNAMENLPARQITPREKVLTLLKRGHKIEKRSKRDNPKKLRQKKVTVEHAM